MMPRKLEVQTYALEIIELTPAQSGYFILQHIPGNEIASGYACKEPVLAWAVEGEFLIPHPVTNEGIKVESVPILRPDGSVAIANGQQWASLEDWLEDQE